MFLLEEFVLFLRHFVTVLPIFGLVACVSTPNSTPNHLRFQHEIHGRSASITVIRDEKLCADDTKEKQDCPIQFFIDDINSGHFYINNKTNYYLKDENYKFTVKNCTDECSICETELKPSELTQKTIRLTVDDQGLPLILNAENQLLCKAFTDQKKPINISGVETSTTVNLAADTLFKFDRSSLNDLLPKGKLEVIDVANKIKNDYVKVSQINLTGHTDRLGNDLYNLNLGEKRAQTVRQLLITNGVPATVVQVKSAGETMPVTDGCFAVKEREALKECLQLDRRVTVEIIGISK